MPTETNLLDIYDDNTATDEQILALGDSGTWVFTRTKDNEDTYYANSGIRGLWVFKTTNYKEYPIYEVSISIGKPQNKYSSRLTFHESFWFGGKLYWCDYKYQYLLERNKQSGTKIQFHGYKYKLWVSEHYLALTNKERAD